MNMFIQSHVFIFLSRFFIIQSETIRPGTGVKTAGILKYKRSSNLSADPQLADQFR